MTVELNTSFSMMMTVMMMIFILTIFSATPVSSRSTRVSYNDHCGSIVPESTPIEPDTSIFPTLQTVNSRYSGGEQILGTASSSRFSFKPSTKYVSFEPTKDIFKTNVRGVYKIEASLVFQTLDARRSIPLDSDHLTFHQYTNLTNLLRFQLGGFWSQYSGKLCMIGSASWSTKEGKHLGLDALLKLNYPMNPTFSTSLVTGTLESLSPSVDLNYFEPISILVFTSSSNYKYTLVSDEFCKGCAEGIDIPQNKSLALQSGSFCSTVGAQTSTFQLEYSKECASLQNCTIFGHEVEYLPPAMYLNPILCSEEERMVQYLAGFGNDTYNWYSKPFEPTTSLIAEGSWDRDKNQLCIVACRILNSTDTTLGNARVGDCSVRLSLRYPAFWSIRSRTNVVGQIWSNKTVDELGYFRRIEFGGYRNSLQREVPGLRYEYTEIERARKFCPVNRAAAAKRKGEMYPNSMVNSDDMRFSILVKDFKGRKASGFAYPVSVGDQIYQPYNNYQYVMSKSQSNSSDVGEKRSSSSSASLNISYAITLTELPVNTPHYLFSSPNYSYIIPVGRMEINAEGIYDDQTGSLCMVGCRRGVGSDMDCELVLKLQFPPTNAKTGGSIEGTMESLRKNTTDPLYLDPLRLSSVTFYSKEAKKSLRRMDLEVTMVLVSNTLACVFVALQIFHAKKNCDSLPFVSVVMVAILTLGYMIPLALNYEALFMRNHNHQRNVLARGGGWVEANEVIVRVVMMLAFLLQVRLLQLAVSARLNHQNHKAVWKSETKAFCVSLPYYAVCFLIAFLVKGDKNNQVGNHLDPVKVAETRTLLTPEGGGGIFERIPWEALRSYFGFLVDGFLLPQIVLNVLGNSVVNKALCVPFYVGTSMVRLVPHAYDIYRACNYARREYYGSYIYADPSADLYSTAWDVVISCGCVVFAGVIYFQQRFGGCCFLPRRLRDGKSQPHKVNA